MTLDCPVCDETALSKMYLENGMWAVEPLDGYDVDADGHLCADWDAENLEVYFHED